MYVQINETKSNIKLKKLPKVQQYYKSQESISINLI